MSHGRGNKSQPSAKELKEAYAELDLQPGTGLSEVKAAYRRLARALHPDLNPGSPGVLMTRVNRAYRLLLDHLAAQAPEESGPGRARAPRAARDEQPPRGKQPSAAPAPVNHGGMETWQEQPLPLAGCRLRGVVRAGGDVVYQVEVSGRPESMELPLRRERPCSLCRGGGVITSNGRAAHCPACGGRGRVTCSERVHLSMPAAWRPGQRMVVPGPSEGGRVLVELHNSFGRGGEV